MYDKPGIHDAHQATTRNQLLSAMDSGDFERLRPHLARRNLGLHDVLIEPGEPIKTLYFPESGLTSFVSPNDVETEVGIVGREGFVGVCVILDIDSMPLKASGQLAGAGFDVPRDVLLELAANSASLRKLIGRYTHVFMMQAASTAYANAHFTVEQRLARWLLMAHDRVDGDELALTHEFLAVMLGVRRPGVTVATHMLEGNGLIRARRGRITVLNRDKLAALAGDSYGMAEAEYERLIAPRIRPHEMRLVV